MRDRLEARLKDLKAEFEKGQQQLSDLESQSAALRNMLLRISGAIQVLEEELTAETPAIANGHQENANPVMSEVH